MKKLLTSFFLVFLFIASVSVPLFVGCSSSTTSESDKDNDTDIGGPSLPTPDPVFNAVLSGALLSWDEIANVDSFTLVYTFESFCEDVDDIDNKVELFYPTYLVTHGAGVITYSIIAHFDEEDYFESSEHVGIITELGLLEAALENAAGYRSVKITSSGSTRVNALMVHMRLEVFGKTIMNFDEQGNVVNSYKETLSHARSGGGNLLLGNGPAISAATRGDRVFFDAESDTIQSQRATSINQQLDAVTFGGNINVQSMDEWLNIEGSGHRQLAPYGFLTYIVNEDTISDAESMTIAHFSSGTTQANITMNRHALSFDKESGHFSFTFIMDAGAAGAVNRYEVIRAGGLNDMTYHELGLTFTIDQNMNLVSYRTLSRYDAHDFVDANTRVDTTNTFHFSNVPGYFESPWIPEIPSQEDESEEITEVVLFKKED
ncbi:MAG: hypothetical protein FWE01_02120 [Firmicutes bacterium]|nr:hypothetical protein [Bacillota bacterium]